jgi:hypothetical protein
MHRLIATVVLALAVARPAQADTNVTVFGGGFAFSGGSSFDHFHQHQHHRGSIWRRSHEFGNGVLFHQRNHQLRLGSPHPQLFISPRKHRHRDLNGSFFSHSRKHGGGSRVIVIIPVPLDGSIVTLRRHSSVIVVNPSAHSRVPLPSRKPFAIAISPPAQ